MSVPVTDFILPMNLLIVEDNDEFREMLMAFFSKRFKSVQGANNGEEGFKAIQSQSFDFMITDVRMPIMSGVQLLQKLKENRIFLKTIILTGYSEQEVQSVKDDPMVLRVLSKPILPREILEILVSATRNA